MVCVLRWARGFVRHFSRLVAMRLGQGKGNEIQPHEAKYGTDKRPQESCFPSRKARLELDSVLRLDLQDKLQTSPR